MVNYNSVYTGKQIDNSQRAINALTNAPSQLNQDGTLNTNNLTVLGSKVSGAVANAEEASVADNYSSSGTIAQAFQTLESQIESIYLTDFSQLGYTEPSGTQSFNGNLPDYCTNFPYGKRAVFSIDNTFYTTYPKLASFLMVNSNGSNYQSQVFGNHLQFSVVAYKTPSIGGSHGNISYGAEIHYAVGGLGEAMPYIMGARKIYYFGNGDNMPDVFIDGGWHMTNEKVLFSGWSTSVALYPSISDTIRGIYNDDVSTNPQLKNIYLKVSMDDVDYEQCFLIPLTGLFLQSGQSFVWWATNGENLTPLYSTISLTWNASDYQYTITNTTQLSPRYFTKISLIGF